eukprot:Sdes_comp18808_c0_seq1m9224
MQYRTALNILWKQDIVSFTNCLQNIWEALQTPSNSILFQHSAFQNGVPSTSPNKTVGSFRICFECDQNCAHETCSTRKWCLFYLSAVDFQAHSFKNLRHFMKPFVPTDLDHLVAANISLNESFHLLESSLHHETFQTVLSTFFIRTHRIFCDMYCSINSSLLPFILLVFVYNISSASLHFF